LKLKECKLKGVAHTAGFVIVIVMLIVVFAFCQETSRRTPFKALQAQYEER